MSYPEPAYDGDTGEVLATYRPSDATADISYPNGNTAHYLATGDTTDYGFGLYRWNMGAGPSGPGPHFHRTFSESFFVLLGTIRIFDGADWIEATPGDFVHVPPGGIHGFRNESGEPASMLIHFAPGAPRESYFEGLVALHEMNPEDQGAFAIHHDNVWLD